MPDEPPDLSPTALYRALLELGRRTGRLEERLRLTSLAVERAGVHARLLAPQITDRLNEIAKLLRGEQHY